MEIRRIRENESDGYFETLAVFPSAQVMTEETKKRIFRELIDSRFHSVFVAVEDGRIIGCLTLVMEPTGLHPVPRARIEDVAVRKEWQGKGVCKMLESYAHTLSLSTSCYKTQLECTEENVPLYEKLGYVRHGVCMRKEGTKRI